MFEARQVNLKKVSEFVRGQEQEEESSQNWREQTAVYNFWSLAHLLRMYPNSTTAEPNYWLPAATYVS